MKPFAVVALLALTACSPNPVGPTLEPASTPLVYSEGMASTTGGRCRVEVERIKPPTSGPHYWIRATYHGPCIDPNGRQYPYWPAPRWELVGNASVGAQAWGADSYIAYVWPEVPGTYTIRAKAPVGVAGTIEVAIP